jgi:arylsulfatase A-like enzyme
MSRRRKKARSRPAPEESVPKASRPGRWPWLLGAAALLGLGAGGLWLGLEPREPCPVVLISIDTLRADRLPLYGYKRIETPAIDALAKDGVVFENAYSHVPLTLPSHSTMFTGLLPFEHGVRNNTGFTLAPSHPNVVAELAQAGYATGAMVSAFVLRPETGIGAGFGHYDAKLSQGAAQFSIAEVQRDGMETAEAAMAWLQGQAERRFFLFLHLYEPHAPYRPPQRYRDRYPSAYDGDVAYADEIVGRFLAELKQLGRYDESLVVLLSDHGEGLGDHGEQEHGVFVYREALHVPMVLKFPHSRWAGRRVSRPVGLADVAPTLRDWVGLPRAERQSGRSLLEALDADGPALEPIYAESLYARYHFGWKEVYALTDSKHSYILAPRDELYDIAKDPGQRENLVAWEPKIREQMRLRLQEIVASTTITAPGQSSAEELAALEALGYVGAPSLTEDADLPDSKDKVDDLERYTEAIGLLRRKDFVAARDLLVEVLRENPRMVDAWDRLTDAYERLGKEADAVEAQRKSLELAPDRPMALLKMALFLAKLHRLDEAIQHGELAAAKLPGKAYMMLGRLCAYYQQPDKALHFARKAAQAEPAALPFVEGLIAHRERRFADARTSLQRAVDELEKRGGEVFPDLNFYLADCLARDGEMAEAERRFRLELKDHPLNVSAGVRLAALYMAEGKTRERDEVLERLAAEFPASGTYDALAEAYNAFGLAEKAKHWQELARKARGEGSGD